jgi:hypothetical protein
MTAVWDKPKKRRVVMGCWFLVLGLCMQLPGCSNPKRSILDSTFIPSVSAGVSSTCVTFADAKLMCYGENVGNASAPISNINPVKANIGLVKFFALSNENPFGCAIAGSPDPNNAAGPVWCWVDHGDPAPVGIPNAISLSVGGPGACAVLQDHSVTCWALTSATPIISAVDPKHFPPAPGGKIVLPAPATQVSVGGDFACALSASGPQVYCWGKNDVGQLGIGTDSHTSPNDEFDGNVAVSNLAAKEVTTGTQFACAIAIDNTVQCWGSTVDGELGNGTINQAFFATPQTALGINNALHISAGEAFACATLTDQSTKCWGDNLGPIPDASTLGIGRPIPGATGGPQPKPFFMDHPSYPVKGLSNAVYVSGGGVHACASGPGAAMHCWGLNEFGELANGDVNKKNSLVAVSP